MNLSAHQEAAFQAIINVTTIRIVLIIAMRPDVAMTMEAMAMEAMAMEAAEGSSTQSAPKPTTPTASIVRKNRGRRRRTARRPRRPTTASIARILGNSSEWGDDLIHRGTTMSHVKFTDVPVFCALRREFQ